MKKEKGKIQIAKCCDRRHRDTQKRGSEKRQTPIGGPLPLGVHLFP